MAARKMTRKKSARRAAKRGKSKQAALLQTIDRELKDLAKQLEIRLRPLRKEIAKAEKRAGAGAAKLLGQARARLGEVKITGHGDWEKFLRRSRADLGQALGQLERSMRKASRPRRKKVAARRAKAAMRRARTAAPVRRKATRRKATRKKAAAR